MEDEKPRLVLLDLMLPGTDGIIVMKSIHDVADVPIIFLSAYGQDQVIARAFEMGAADYVVKPFSPTELVARIHAAPRSPPAALRRPSHDFRQPGREPYEFGEMVIDFERRTTTLGGLMLKLTPTEPRCIAAPLRGRCSRRCGDARRSGRTNGPEAPKSSHPADPPVSSCSPDRQQDASGGCAWIQRLHLRRNLPD